MLTSFSHFGNCCGALWCVKVLRGAHVESFDVCCLSVLSHPAELSNSVFWQERNRLPDVADDELNFPVPEPLRFNIDEPALLDDDMVEILLLEEASPGLS